MLGYPLLDGQSIIKAYFIAPLELDFVVGELLGKFFDQSVARDFRNAGQR